MGHIHFNLSTTKKKSKRKLILEVERSTEELGIRSLILVEVCRSDTRNRSCKAKFAAGATRH